MDNEVLIDAHGWRFLVPLRLPEADVIIEVVAPLPVAAQVSDVTRRLGRRHLEAGGKANYPPTIAELIMLVEPHPEPPPGRNWKNVTLLTVSFDGKLKTVGVEYCVNKCKVNKETGAPHPKRKTISYSAPEEQVLMRLEQRLAELTEFGDAATKPR